MLWDNIIFKFCNEINYVDILLLLLLLFLHVRQYSMLY